MLKNTSLALALAATSMALASCKEQAPDYPTNILEDPKAFSINHKDQFNAAACRAAVLEGVAREGEPKAFMVEYTDNEQVFGIPVTCNGGEFTTSVAGIYLDPTIPVTAVAAANLDMRPSR